MTDIATLKTRLTEAEEALHKLQLGQREVTVNNSGFGDVTYAQVNAGKLESYIARLKTEIARQEGSTTRRGPIRFSF